MAQLDGVSSDADDSGRVSLIYDPKARGLFFQAVLIVVVAVLVYFGISNAIHNLAKQGIASGFGFLSDRAGVDIGLGRLGLGRRQQAEAGKGERDGPQHGRLSP